MSVYERHDESIDTPDGAVAKSTKASRWELGPGQIIAGITGLIFVGFGVLAITRAGIDSTLNEPTVNSGGFVQSAWVGIGEVLAGLLLLAGAANARNRSILGATGGAMFIAGLVIAAGSPQILVDIGTQHRSGWLLLIGGVIAMVAAILPVMVHSARKVSRTDPTPR
jgi:hypothetical protein